MTEVAIAALVSAMLVVVEFIGVVVSKWTVAKKRADKAGHLAAARAVLEYRDTVSENAQDEASLTRQIAEASRAASSQSLRNAFADFVPGPELCFLSLTVLVSLFLTYNWATDVQRRAISPFLAGNANANPILLLSLLCVLVAWVSALIWREVIVLDVQVRWRKLSVLGIVALGGGALSISIYYLLAGRGL